MILQETATEVNSQYVIVIPQDASRTEQYAASELKDYIFKINGVTLTVETDDTPIRAKEICIGDTNREADVPEPELVNDGFWLHNDGGRLFIDGENDRGTLYGVYGFLEDVWDCRFYTATVEKVPHRSHLKVPDDLDVVKNPVFEFRDTNWHAALSGDFCAKRGYNGYFSRLSEDQGGSILYHDPFVHTFDYYVPAAQYMDEHPEYFSGRLEGQVQLCLTNPEVLEIVTQRVLEDIRNTPGCTIFSISQNDCYNPCTCEECARVDGEEGSHAGTLIRFINAVAEEVEKEFPDVIIDTLAYQYTRTPPKLTRPRKNVAVRFCTIEACFSHPLAECTAVSRDFASRVNEAAMQQDLAGWGRICDRVYIWDYTTDFAHYAMTFPNLYILDDNIRYFAANSVVGLFEQGNGESISPEFGELRAYVLSKLMWNPEGDVKSYIRDFLKGYYGDGAGPIGAYLDALCTRVEEENIHVSIYDSPSVKLFPAEMIQLGADSFDRALVLTEGDKKRQNRLRRSQLTIRYVQLYRMSPSSEEAKESARAFAKDVKDFGITRLKEWTPVENTLKGLGAD